jgi:hypothetical protein
MGMVKIVKVRITSHSSRTNNSWLFTPSSSILANHYLPLSEALVHTKGGCLKILYMVMFFAVTVVSANTGIMVNIFPDTLILPNTCKLNKKLVSETDCLESETFGVAYSCRTLDDKKYWLKFRLNDVDLVAELHNDLNILDIIETNLYPYTFLQITVQGSESKVELISYCTDDVCMDLFGDYDDSFKKSLASQLGG